MTDTDDMSREKKTRMENVSWRRVINIAGLVVLIAIVLPFVVYTVPQVVGADHSYVVLSGSMAPTISTGDVIIVDSVDASQVQKGDIVTYGGERPTTHRVIEVTEQDGTPAFRTEGDANENPDRQLVTPDELHGKVMSIGGQLLIIPYIGYLIEFAGTEIGFIALFIMPLVLLVVSEVWHISSLRRTSSDASNANGSKTTTTEPTDEDTHHGSPNIDSIERSESSDSAIAFSAAELRLGLVGFGAFLAYSVWVTYATGEVWAFSVAGSVAAAFLLLTGLYVTGGSTDRENEGVDRRQISAADGGTAIPDGSSLDVDLNEEIDSLKEAVGQDGDDDSGGGETYD